MMQHRQNSLIHRSGNVLCGELSRGPQSVNRSLGHPPYSQSLEPNCPEERTSSPTTLTFTAPMLAPDRKLRMPVTIVMPPGYYAELPTPHNLIQPQFPDYYNPDDNFPVGIYNMDLFMPAYESFGPSLGFGETFPEPVVAHQPSIPPPAPQQSITPSPPFDFHPCRWLSGPHCNGLAPGRNREMGEHLRTYHRFVGHERDSVQCEWEGCSQTIQRMNVPRHIVSRHLLAAANCRFCRRRFSRPDVVARHERTCTVVPQVSTTSIPNI